MSGAQLLSQGGLTTLPFVFPSQDESVTHLGQELAQKLGLRVRKAYKRPQVGAGAWAGMEMGRPEEGDQEPLGDVREGAGARTGQRG